mmetsp:Transcript_156580/g.502609  ORF Transcript_156580/g.502609 Transcript_156580/m.502609 type:complete len:201 (-) Transcript_156580:494-1096(-)
MLLQHLGRLPPAAAADEDEEEDAVDDDDDDGGTAPPSSLPAASPTLGPWQRCSKSKFFSNRPIGSQTTTSARMPGARSKACRTRALWKSPGWARPRSHTPWAEPLRAAHVRCRPSTSFCRGSTPSPRKKKLSSSIVVNSMSPCPAKFRCKLVVPQLSTPATTKSRGNLDQCASSATSAPWPPCGAGRPPGRPARPKSKAR